jgi:hypothetical protein
LALEGDKKIFDAVLKQLQSPPPSSKSLDADFSGNFTDDDFVTLDIELENICK